MGTPPINEAEAKLKKLVAKFEKRKRSSEENIDNLKRELKQLEAKRKQEAKEFFSACTNEQKEYYFTLIKEIGFDYEDIAIVGGCLALLKDKIDSGNANAEIDACIARYQKLVADSTNIIEADKLSDESDDALFREETSGYNAEGIDA